MLRFDPDLVVLLESKVCRKWAKRNGHRVGELNLGGVRFAERRTCVLRWHDLLEAWWRLAEIGVLSPAEHALVQDMLSYAHQDFGHLLPFGSLRRVGADPTRRKWRLRSLLREATGIQPERVGLVHVRLDNALGALSLQRAALDIDEDDRLTLHMWPGELKPQAEHLYAAGHADRLCELAAPPDWRVEPQPLLGFRNAPRRTRVYLTCTLDAPTYARRWEGEDWSHVGAHHRDYDPHRAVAVAAASAVTHPSATPSDWTRSCARSAGASRICARACTSPARGRGPKPNGWRTKAGSWARSAIPSTPCWARWRSRCSVQRIQEQPVDPIVSRQLGVESDREQTVLTRRHRMTVHLGEDLHVRAVLGDPRRADEHRPQRASLQTAQLEVGLERCC